jgi:hypothetical protein
VVLAVPPAVPGVSSGRSAPSAPFVEAVATDCPLLPTSEVPSDSTSDSVPATSSAPEVSLASDERDRIMQAGDAASARSAGIAAREALERRVDSTEESTIESTWSLQGVYGHEQLKQGPCRRSRCAIPREFADFARRVNPRVGPG